jgi:hypothetical protein
MRTKNQIRESLESLDDRVVPSTFTTSHVGGTLVITQTSSAVGTVEIVDTYGFGSVFVDDEGDANPPTVVSTLGYANLTVNLMPTDVTPVVYDIMTGRAGNVTLNVNNTSPRPLFFDGGFTVFGNLMVNSGNGGLAVSESVAPLRVHGNAAFHGGSGADTLDLSVGSGTMIGGKLILSKFNTLSTNAGDSIGGDLNFNDSGEGTSNSMFLMDTHVGGNLNYVGGTAGDVISLSGSATTVDGNVTVNFRGQSATDASLLSQSFYPTNVIGGNVTVTGDNLGTDFVSLYGVIDGNINFNLEGGTNTAIIGGTIMGSSVRYTGGAESDSLVYTPLIGSSAPSLRAIMGAGGDAIIFGAGSASPSYAYLDFGAGVDALVGSIVFPATILNLP